jgi:hypothetical protein
VIPKDDIALLHDLAAREGVRETVHRYCWAVDKGELADVMALFAPECQLELAPGKRYGDRAAVGRWYGAYMANRMGMLRHLIHNLVIDLEADGDRARARSYFDAVGELGGESIFVAGYYDDKLIRGDSGWRFADKIISLDCIVPIGEGWAGKRFKRTILRNVE